MGRLKKDHSGWSTAGKWIKYQYPKIDEDSQMNHHRKNTKKWCKGRRGIPHEYELIEKNKFLDWFWVVEKCKNCGKQNYKSLKKKPL